MRMPGVEPGSQAWEACMIPLHYMRASINRSEINHTQVHLDVDRVTDRRICSSSRFHFLVSFLHLKRTMHPATIGSLELRKLRGRELNPGLPRDRRKY